MATTWKAPTWRMPNEKNQSKFESYSLDFDSAISNYINCGGQSLLNGLTAFSISFWIKTNGTQQDYATVIGYQSSTSQYVKFAFYPSEKDRIRFNLRPGTTNPVYVKSSAGSIPDGEWVHVVGVGDSNNLSNLNLYINGVLDNDATLGNMTTLAQSTDIYIGTDPGAATTREFNGDISQTCIFDYALSSTQVSSLYNSGSPINPMTLKPAPIAYYPLGGNASTAGNIGSDTLSVPNVAVPDASVFDFDGSSNQFINNGYFNELDSSDLSFSIWLKKTNTDYAQVVDSQTAGNSGILIAINSSDQVFVRVNTLTASTTTSGFANIGFQRDKWQNIILTYNNTTRNLIVYLNNQPVSNTTGSLTTKGASLELKIGGVSGSYFTGQISNAQIWSTELSSSEVETLYNSGVPLLTGTQPQASSLKAWYKLDQSANWEADTTGNWQIPDAVSSYPQSFDFDNDYIDCGTSNAIASASSFAVSAWVKIDTGGVFFSSGTSNTDRVFFSIDSSNVYFGVKTGSGGVISWANSFTNTWYHIVGVVDAGTSYLYVNGIQRATGSVSTLSSTAGNNVKIGNTTSPMTSAPFYGKISNVQVFNSALPATGTDSVETLYNNGTPLTTAIASANLKLWAKLDNTATWTGSAFSIPDASGNGNTGTSSGMTEQNLVNNNVSVLNGESSGMNTSNLVTSTLTRQVPYNSYSLYFDGSSDYVEVPDDASLKPTSAITCSMWFKGGTQNTFRYLLSKYFSSGSHAYGFYTGSTSTRLSFYIRNSATTNLQTPDSTAVVFNDEWHHAVGVYDGSKVELYIDGVSNGSTAGTGSINYTDGLLYFGTFAGAPTVYEYDGLLANISIFDEALTSTEVLKLYNSGVPSDLSSFSPQPVSWWSLGSDSYFDGTNYICPDLIGTNNSNVSNGLNANSLVGDAPNSTANGTSTNMTIDANLTGNAPNSSNNSFSVNMSYDDRVSGSGDVPS